MGQEVPKNAYTLGCRGKTNIHKAFLESIHGLEAEMEEAGFQPIDSHEARLRFGGMSTGPEPWSPRRMTMDTHATFTAIAFMVFIAEPITKASIEVVASKFFEHILPRLRKMLALKKGSKDSLTFPIQFSPSMFFEAEQVVVTVVVDINKREDFSMAETLIPIAFQKAEAWLEQRGRVEPYMTYRIRNGQLNNFPTLSAQEPSVTKY